MNRTPVINLILIGVVFFELWGIFHIWSGKESGMGSVQTKPPKEIQLDKVRDYEKKDLPLNQYADIVRLNLFSPQREEFIEVVPEPEPEPKPEPEPEIKEDKKVKALTTDKITLYGVIVMEDYQKALVTSDSSKKNKSGSIWVTRGDTLDDFVVETIEKDRIIVSADSKQYSVLLYDENKPKKRSAIPQNPVQKTVVNQPPKILVPEPVGPSPETEPAKDTNEQVTDEDYEIIVTPFGSFKRRKQK